MSDRRATIPGLGSLRVWATFGASRWKTSIFPDTSRNTFRLGIKSSVRRAEHLNVGDRVAVTVELIDL